MHAPDAHDLPTLARGAPMPVERWLAPFRRFARLEAAGGIVLLAMGVVALVWANSPWREHYEHLRHAKVALGAESFGLKLSLEHWINDALMAIFFLLIGLELERELYVGELSNFRNALLPIFAAAGGMLMPAAIHYAFNAGTPAQAGFGIPMATDIAFAIGVLALLGSRIPAALKVFVVAFAVIDDLGAIIVIAAFYTADLSAAYLAGAIAVWALLVALNRFLRVMSLIPYLIGGALMWFLMMKSGVHATIAGVMLAFAIPFSPRDAESASPSQRLENFLHKPVAFIILPLFALANTGIVIGADWAQSLASSNSLGIAAGLLVGKPLGVTLLCFIAVSAGVCRLPVDLRWSHMLGAGMLGGIGFTMSIFIANLAFAASPETINASKMAILLSSLVAGVIGYVWLRLLCKAPPAPVH